MEQEIHNFLESCFFVIESMLRSDHGVSIIIISLITPEIHSLRDRYRQFTLAEALAFFLISLPSKLSEKI